MKKSAKFGKSLKSVPYKEQRIGLTVITLEDMTTSCTSSDAISVSQNSSVSVLWIWNSLSIHIVEAE